MYRLLIVDDEPIILNGLVQLYQDVEHFDLDIFSALSADEALNWLGRTKIDIVVSDIRMPGMNGLELQHQILLRWPHCKIIFITGFDDFTYVQQAIRNGSLDYLLKTDSEEKMILAVDKAIRKIEEELNRDNLIRDAKHQMHMVLPVLQKQYLTDLMDGDHSSYDTRKKQFAEMNISLEPDRKVLLVLGRVDAWKEDYNATDRILMLYAIQNIAMEYLSEGATIVSFAYDRIQLIWLIQPHQSIAPGKSEEWDHVIPFVNGTLEHIQSKCKDLLQLKISFVVGSESIDWEQLSYKFNRLKILFSRGLGMGHELLIIEQKEVEGEKASGSNPLLNIKKTIESLQTFLESGQKESFFCNFSELIKSVFNRSDVEERFKLEAYFILISFFMTYLNRRDVYDELKEAEDFVKLIRRDASVHWVETCNLLWELADELFHQQINETQAREHIVISRVQQYVENNLSGDISLIKLGEIVAFSPPYLSRLYKKNTGESISDFISNARIGKAKKLLLINAYKIHEVAAAVGFESDPSYFYRFFKKMTNITPQEYRASVNRL